MAELINNVKIIILNKKKYNPFFRSSCFRFKQILFGHPAKNLSYFDFALFLENHKSFNKVYGDENGGILLKRLQYQCLRFSLIEHLYRKTIGENNLIIKKGISYYSFLSKETIEFGNQKEIESADFVPTGENNWDENESYKYVKTNINVLYTKLNHDFLQFYMKFFKNTNLKNFHKANR